MDPAAGGHIVGIEGDGAAAVGGVRGNDHALADILALHHGPGCQVGHNAHLLADQILGAVPLGNARQDAALPLAVKDGQMQQLLVLFQGIDQY